ncbi:NAD(P)-dependent alcohol dehydrogenase [Nocardia sp. R16R-3T]
MPIIQAAVAVAKNAPLELRELRLDDPRPDEVLVRMRAVGVCHTDATVLESPEFPPPFPAVLGHEGAGVVEAVGADVDHVKPGDKVVLSFGSCGRCRKCVQRHPAYCDDFNSYNFFGVRLDGSPTLFDGDEPLSGHYFAQSSFATHALGHRSNVVKVDDDMDLDIAGPLGCGLLTGASSVRNILRPDEGDSFVVYGAGGVGYGALMMAKVMGCDPIIAVDINDQRLALAEELGATHTINGKDADLADRIREITEANQGVDCAIDTTGLSTICKVGVETLRRGGRLGLIASHRQDGVGLDVAAIPLGAYVYGAVMGDAIPGEMVPLLVDLHRKGQFPVDRLIKFYDLEDINQAFADSADGSTIKPVIRFPR